MKKKHILSRKIGSSQNSLAKIIVVYFFLCLVAVIFLMPLFWMVITSLKTADQTYNHPELIMPHPWTFENFVNIFTETPMLVFIKNSVIVTVLCVIGAVISTSLVAYAFGRLHWFGRDALFVLLLTAMMIPVQATMIPVFIVFQKLGMVNTFAPLILPSWFAASAKGAFFVFMQRQFIMSIPFDIDESARIDGCGYFKIYSHMIVPLLKPALSAVAVFSFMDNWNNFLGALIYLNKESKFTLPIGIQYFQTQEFTDWNRLMSAALVSIIPCIIIFFFSQKYLVKGVTLSGSKG